MKKEMTKEDRVKKEEKRLMKIFADLDKKKKDTTTGLIQRAAHIRITLEDLAADLDKNGYTEMFRQGKDNPPYERKRPSADLYTTMTTIYQKTIKQLTDLLPKDKDLRKTATDIDDFEDFIVRRDD